MNMNEPTQKLFDDLKQTTSLDAFMAKYDLDHMLMSFSDYLTHLMGLQKITKAELIREVNMTKSYAYEIFNGFKTPARDKVLLIAYGLHADVNTTQRLLLLSKYNPLHPKDKRDSIILYGLFNGLNLINTNQLLYDFDMTILE